MKLLDDLKSTVSLPADKDRTVYMILAILLGALGVHNFYAGNKDKAVAQLLLGTVGICLCCLGPTLSWITAIMDVVNLGKNDAPAAAAK